MSASLESLQGVGGDVDLAKKLSLDGFTGAFSLNERLQAGKALRDSTPRRTHRAWLPRDLSRLIHRLEEVYRREVDGIVARGGLSWCQSCARAAE
jgi:hypothetical protein